VKPTTNVHTVVHTSKNAHIIIKPSANVITVVNPTTNAKSIVMNKSSMHKKPPRKSFVKTIDIVRAIVDPIVKPKPVRRSDITI